MVGKDAVDLLFDVIERTDPAAAEARAVEAGDGEPEEVDISLRVHVQPGAGRTAVVGRHGDALKIKVAAPPEGGRANEAVAQILSTTLGVAPSGITLVSGAKSRSKRFRIGPVELEAVRRLLASAEAVPKVSGGARPGNARGGGGVR
jgi:uncharacterized protein (TIGR00251 family)